MKTYKRIVLIAMLFAGIWQVSIAQNFKFGHVNSNDLIQSMPELDSARILIENLRQELADYYEVMSDELESKYETYMKENQTYSSVVKQVKEQELSDMDRRIQEFQTNAQNQMIQRQAELFDPIQLKVQKAISDTGQENNFIYIFDIAERNLLYFDKSRSIDITSLVKNKLGLK